MVISNQMVAFFLDIKLVLCYNMESKKGDIMKIFNLKGKILKNVKYKLLPVFMAGTIGISMSACGNKMVSRNHSSNYNSSSSSTVVDSTVDATMDTTSDISATMPSTNEIDLKDLDEYNLDGIEIQFDSYTNDDFQDYISNVEVVYKDSDLFNIEEALELYNNMDIENISSNSVINNNKVDENKLYQLVLENNKKFLASDKTNKYKDINQSQLKSIVSIVVTQLNEQLQSNPEIDTNILDNTLKNLKIFECEIFGNASVELEDEKLCLNFKAINSLQQQNPDVDMLERTVKHESDHLIQVSYPKNDEFKYNMGISYSYNNLSVNPLYWQWYVEGSAEKLTLKEIDDAPFSYRDQVKGLESLTLATITDKDNEVTDIEDLSLQKDLNKLFEYFNATTENQKEEVIKMMFSYDIIFNDNKEFMERAKEKKGSFDLIQLYDYQDELKGSICQTLTKIFYSNLANSLVEQEMSLNDVYSLIRVFETEMCRISDYDNTTKTDVNSTFVNNYNNIQNEFFTNLSIVTNMSNDEIKASYYAFSDNYCENAKYKNENNYTIDINIDGFSEDKNLFLEYTSKSRVSHIKQNVNR